MRLFLGLGTFWSKGLRYNWHYVCLSVAFLILIHPWRFSEIPFFATNYISSEEILLELKPNAQRSPDSAYQEICQIDIHTLKTQVVTPLSNESVIPGGEWKPNGCQPKFDSTIIIPYRDREEHLRELLGYLHPFLQAQNLSYRILVIEQIKGKPFNRAKLFNVGVAEALKLKRTKQCFIFHDVDLVPLNPQNLYACSNLPIHLSAYVDTFRFNLPYKTLFGGAIAIPEDLFKGVNGFSNRFSGWGGEDDDFWINRLSSYTNNKMLRYDQTISKYRMLPHIKASPSEDRFQMLKKGHGEEILEDGLDSVDYSVISAVERDRYFHILVTV